MAEQARTFIGIDLDLTTCEKLVLVQEDLQPIFADRGAKVRWTPPQNLHLTIKFVGDVNRSLIPRMRGVLRESVANQKDFQLVLQGIGAFPKAAKPRILFARVSDGAEETTALAGRVEEALADLGLPRDDRDYIPHVTVGRVRTPGKKIDISDVADALGDLPLGTSLIRDIVLYESHLTPRGAQYQVLSRLRFRAD